MALTGDLPDKNQAQMIDALLVSSIDHGVTPPSCQAVRTVTLTGSPLNAALAAGILAISKHHGGAIDDCMTVLSEAVQQKNQVGITAQEQAEKKVDEFKAAKKRFPGFGHRYHTKGPPGHKAF